MAIYHVNQVQSNACVKWDTPIYPSLQRYSIMVGVGARLQTTVVNRGGSTSCVGDTVIYTCNISVDVHIWRITRPGFDVTTATLSNALGLPTFPAPGASSPFVITIAVDDNVTGVITTVLTVTSFAGLDGTNISCAENAMVTGDDIQETTAAVFGECC
jgi:hypothetical protein